MLELREKISFAMRTYTILSYTTAIYSLEVINARDSSTSLFTKTQANFSR